MVLFREINLKKSCLKKEEEKYNILRYKPKDINLNL